MITLMTILNNIQANKEKLLNQQELSALFQTYPYLLKKALNHL